jgi:acyl-CoA thioester hydrolase
MKKRRKGNHGRLNDYSIINYLGAMTHPFRFTMNRTVVQADIDELNHVNNVVYLQWIQDVAKNHWLKVGQHLTAEVVWVASRHEIDYLAPAFLGDPIEVGTWVGQPQGARFERFIVIRHAETKKELVKAKTIWVMLDAQTLKPRRVPDDMVALFQ